MLQYLNQKRGQSTLEYVVLIIIIIGALISIQVYIKRGVQGRLRSAADDIGDQYDDGNTNVLKTTKRASETYEEFANGATTSQIGAGGELTNTTDNSVIVNTALTYWGTSS
jgi:cytoskeletal protein RodZ